MPTKAINAAAGTVQVKLGGGVIRSIIGVAAGTSYTFQAKDGPDVNGNAAVLMGASAIPVVAGQSWLPSGTTIPFINGFQMVVTGTPGEVFVQYD